MSLAILYTNWFFVVKSYVNHDKQVVACAALYLSSKLLYNKRKISDFYIGYHKLKYINKLQPPINDDDRNKVVEQICMAEG